MSHFPSTPFLHFILKSERLIFGGPKKEHLNPIKIHSIFIFQLNNQKPYLSLSPPPQIYSLYFLSSPKSSQPNGHLQCVWLEEWKSGRIENDRRIEKWEDRKDFNFPPFCLVGSEKVEGWKKWACINLLIYPC